MAQWNDFRLCISDSYGFNFRSSGNSKGKLIISCSGRRSGIFATIINAHALFTILLYFLKLCFFFLILHYFVYNLKKYAYVKYLHIYHIDM